jgi:hypothetical protein
MIRRYSINPLSFIGGDNSKISNKFSLCALVSTIYYCQPLKKCFHYNKFCISFRSNKVPKTFVLEKMHFLPAFPVKSNPSAKFEVYYIWETHNLKSTQHVKLRSNYLFMLKHIMTLCRIHNDMSDLCWTGMKNKSKKVVATLTSRSGKHVFCILYLSKKSIMKQTR